MGLFDRIDCKYPLPDGFTGELQTKDLGWSMLTHEITKDGRLLIANGFIRQNGDLVESDFTGSINFYGRRYYTGGQSPRHEWHEYNASFVDGLLVKIDLVPKKKASAK